MKWVSAHTVEGAVQAPPSKSLTIRLLAAAALVRGRTVILRPSDCSDARSTLGVIEALGARCHQVGDRLEIEGGAGSPGDCLRCGESGLCLRAFAAVAALRPGMTRLEASGSLLKRPVGMLAESLSALGVAVRTNRGCPPVEITGPLRGGRARVDGGVTSQHLTGLLLACPLACGQSRLEVSNLTSRPYVKMTLDLLHRFGIRVEHDAELREFLVPAGQNYREGLTVAVEGDWSGAAPLLVAGALAGSVEVQGLDFGSAQADRAICDALEKAGARVELSPTGVRVCRLDARAFDFDVSECPDLAPALAALACRLPGKSRLFGIGRLVYKESDRISGLMEGLGRLGGRLERKGNSLLIEGGRLHSAEIDPQGDHRLAMACAVAVLGSSARVGIKDEGCVAKSFPHFFQTLSGLGVEVR